MKVESEVFDFNNTLPPFKLDVYFIMYDKLGTQYISRGRLTRIDENGPNVEVRLLGKDRVLNNRNRLYGLDVKVMYWFKDFELIT